MSATKKTDGIDNDVELFGLNDIQRKLLDSLRDAGVGLTVKEMVSGFPGQWKNNDNRKDY